MDSSTTNTANSSAANFLVELDLEVPEIARRIHEHAQRALTADGIWIAIEPAVRATTRRLHELRDALIERGLVVWAPCFHQRPCPMLARPSDWCHESRAWRQPAYHRALDRLAHLDKRSLQFSFLALGKEPPRASPEALAARVVSTVLREKGRTRFRTCDAGGRLLEWDLLRRTRGPSADRIASLDRGSLALFGGNFRAYEEASALVQEAAEQRVRSAEQEVKREKRELQQARERSARRAPEVERDLDAGGRGGGGRQGGGEQERKESAAGVPGHGGTSFCRRWTYG